MEQTEFNVARSFNRQSSNGKLAFVTKGSMNGIFMRPQIINENVSQFSTLQSTVTSSNIVGQIFKASKDNINGITLALGNGATSTDIDTFESYADSSAVQAEWAMTGGDKPALLSAVIVSPNNGSTKSMEIEINHSDHEWVNTITSINLSNATIELDYYQNCTFAEGKVALFIGDGTNTKSIQLAISEKNAWETFELMESAMTEDGGGTTDVTAITKIGFRVDDGSDPDEGWVDNLHFHGGAGSVDIKLHDMGATIPVSTTTSIDDGTRYTTIGDEGINGTLVSEYTLSLDSITRAYQINGFMAGTAKELASNNLLTIDNYYAITLNYVDGDIKVYGADPSLSTNFYADGFAFTAPNEATAVTAIGTYNDLGFAVFSTQDVHVVSTHITMLAEDGTDAYPGESAQYQEYIEDTASGIVQHVVTTIPAYNNGEMDLRNRPVFMEDGGKIGTMYQDDETDDVYKVIFNITYLYEI